MRKLFGLIIVLAASRGNLVAQAVVNSTGTTLTSGNYIFEYSVGEIAITTLPTGSAALNYAATQGVLQPIFKAVVRVCDVIDQPLLTYPNPATNRFRFVGPFEWITDYAVYAADGKLVRRAQLVNGSIDISTLPDAAYFIKLFPGCGDNYKILKVIKQ